MHKNLVSNLPTRRCGTTLAAWFWCLTVAGTTLAQVPEGFIQLFNGKDFSGWEGNLEFFRIEDGAVVAGRLDERIPRNEFLCTTKTYGDFELRLEVKASQVDVNGGIQIRSKRIPNHHEVSGYQVDTGTIASQALRRMVPEGAADEANVGTDGTSIMWGLLYDESRRNRFLAIANQSELKKVMKPKDWNQFVVRCKGDRIQIWVNGFQTVDYSEPNPKIATSGIIGLQIHSGPPVEIAYRNIFIRELKTSNVGSVQSDGIRIHYEKFGQGPPMILAHGWGSDTQSGWGVTGWIDALQQHRTLISIDIRGHGKSDKPHRADVYSYAAMSRDVLAVMDKLEIEKADYMGYSMGAFMGAWLLGNHADRFNSMVLGGIGDETEESANACIAIAAALRAPNMASISDPLGKAYRAYAESNPNSDLESLALSALKMWPEGYPLELGGKGLGEVDIPVLIVNGDKDHPYVDTADTLAAVIPNARHVKIPGTDHLTTVPDPQFKQVVVAFLRGL
jgi:pimeloyl-ACP methyl ester carboxylesterase